jgi:hypothetical protein
VQPPTCGCIGTHLTLRASSRVDVPNDDAGIVRNLVVTCLSETNPSYNTHNRSTDFDSSQDKLQHQQACVTSKKVKNETPLILPYDEQLSLSDITDTSQTGVTDKSTPRHPQDALLCYAPPSHSHPHSHNCTMRNYTHLPSHLPIEDASVRWAPGPGALANLDTRSPRPESRLNPNPCVDGRVESICLPKPVTRLPLRDAAGVFLWLKQGK